ncbi:hypothetical protein ABE425_05550 [Chryseobacterium cucumeris]
MQKIRKFIQFLYYHTTIDVVDAKTGKAQKATYNILFGLIWFIKYK